jgi:predicted dehydrogenase
VTKSAPNTRESPARIAVIGCGAIARLMHLPGLARHPDVIPHLILVDRDAQRSRALAEEFGVPRTAEDYADVLGDVDGVIVTVPHRLHYGISMDCLRAKRHVLCEKPMAESPREAREMVAAANAAGVALGANHILRLYPVSQKIAQLVREGAIGKLRRITFAWGEKFDWPAASGFYFGQGGAAHGVLADKGPHLLDLICWWLGGKPNVISSRDDSFGGGEAMISLVLERDGCTVDGEFSFLTRYENAYVLEGDAGRIEASLYDFQTLTLTSSAGSRKIKLDTPTRNLSEFGNVMIDNFLAVVRGAEQPLVAGADVLDSIELIDECYARRTRYDMPWHEAWRQVVHA